MSLELFFLTLILVGVFGLILFGVSIIYALLGVPILMAFIAAGFGVFDANLLSAIPSRLFGILNNQLLYSVPLFVLLGKLLHHSKLAEMLLVFLTRGFGNHTASLGLCVLSVSAVLAVSSGIVGATITMLAAIAVPVMLKNGYGEKFSAGLVCAAGTLGQILPPSIVLILLSDQISNAHIATQLQLGNFSPDPVSVGHVFAGSILPGLILVICYGIYTVFHFRNGVQSGFNHQFDLDGEAAHKDNRWISILTFLTLLGVPISIILGVASVSESAIVGVSITVLIILINGQRPAIMPSLRETVEISGMIFGIIIAASVFSLVIRGFGGDQLLASFFDTLPGGYYLPLFFVMLVVFVLGFLMEFVEITYIIVPITAPILFGLGIDPVWFAILMAVNLQISFLTPPLGIALFYYKSVQSISIRVLAQSIVPFVFIQILVLGLIVLIPGLATWLPSVML